MAGPMRRSDSFPTVPSTRSRGFFFIWIDGWPRAPLNALKTCVSLDPGYRYDETRSMMDGWPRAPIAPCKHERSSIPAVEG
jgi:hypothetical protein